MGDPALSLRGLAAGHGGSAVVAGVSLELSRGEILGLLGANGAGKSTLLKTVTGQLPPLAGGVAIDGIDLSREPERAKARLGLAVEGSDLPAALTGAQYLEMVATLRGSDRGSDRGTHRGGASPDVVARLGLDAWMGLPIALYSLGTRAKVAFAAALIGAPPLLIFDESLNGLDPLAAHEVKSIIAEAAGSGRHAVVLATHVVEIVPTLCTRAMFIAGGEVVKCWDAAGLAEDGAAPGRFEARLIAALRSRAGAAERASGRGSPEGSAPPASPSAA